jgi:hypothetical protein
MVGLALLIATPIEKRVKLMTQNQEYLKKADEHAKEFEAQLEPEHLREASMALDSVSLAQEHDPRTRAQVRTDCLSSWLHLLQLLDRFLDPNFDPNDVPQRLVQPPPTRGDVVYPPGADPALIDDPKARAEYEKAIAANREKAVRYRLQIQLGRLNERIPPRAEAFIHDAYTSAARDQDELGTAIETMITDPRRKAGLLKLLTPSRP